MIGVQTPFPLLRVPRCSSRMLVCPVHSRVYYGWMAGGFVINKKDISPGDVDIDTENI
jgi:hypothetical protein